MFSEMISTLNEMVWGPWMLALMLGTGAYLMVRLHFLPIRRLFFALRCAVGLEPEREAPRGWYENIIGEESRFWGEHSIGKQEYGDRRRGVSPFAALTTELAATIGTGNIVGVATAMVLGGPGALVWMIAASFLGLATKLVESTLSVKYRQKNAAGEWVGGPMYTLEYAFPAALTELLRGFRRGKKHSVWIQAVDEMYADKCVHIQGMRGSRNSSRVQDGKEASGGFLQRRTIGNTGASTSAKILGKILATAYAFFAVMASFGMGNMTQSNSIAEAVRVTYGVPPALTGLVLTTVTILVVLGGIRSIAKVAMILVPFMGGFYLLGTAGVVWAHWERVPEGIAAILLMAVTPRAVTGGLLGNLAALASLSMAQAVRYGVSRGVFSNEAGLGAAGITAAAADTKDYIRQGYISMTGVFLDTCIICAMTGLAFAASGLLGALSPEGGFLNGTELVIAVFAGTFGEKGAGFVCISIVLFAFATIIAWAYQGEKVFEYLTGSGRYGTWYHFVYALAVFVGAVCSLDMAWNFSDLCNGLMAVPNLLCVLVMSAGRKGICEEILAYDD